MRTIKSEASAVTASRPIVALRCPLGGSGSEASSGSTPSTGSAAGELGEIGDKVRSLKAASWDRYKVPLGE